MIKSQSSLVNKIYLYIDHKNENNKSDNKYKKKKKIIKNKIKKEEDGEEKGTSSLKNKINNIKKISFKIKENQIKSGNSKEKEMLTGQKNKNKRKIVQLKIYNPNQTKDSFCITDRLSNKNDNNSRYISTVATPNKSYKNSFKNILKNSESSEIKTPKYTTSLLKDYNNNSNKYIHNRNKRIKSSDLRDFYTEINSDLCLTTQNIEYGFMKKYSGEANYIIKEIDEPSYMNENQTTDMFDQELKTDRNSLNDSFLKEIYSKRLKNSKINKDSIKKLRSNNTFVWEPKINKEFNFMNENRLYNSSQKDLFFLRKRNKMQNLTINQYNSLSKTKINQNYYNNLNRTFYKSKSNIKNANISLNSTFCETHNNLIKNNNYKKNIKTKNKSLEPILENERYHYLVGTICTKNKIVKKNKNFLDDYPTYRKVQILIEKNELKGIDRYKAMDKSKKIINNKYNVSPIKKPDTKLKMNNIVLTKKNININNNKNRTKSKKCSIKNRAASMDNSISNLTTLSNTQLFNGKIEDYLITKELGKGSYAVVKLAMHRVTKEKFAIKIYTRESLLDPQKRNTVKNEINILKQLNHINIMKLYEVINSSKYLYLVLEYIKGVSLLDVIKTEKLHYIEQHKAIKLFIQIVKGISYCQSKNINHRDIKLENILVIKDDIIKIIDFGFAVKGSKDTYQKLFCGTPSYMPPEIVNKEKYIAQYSDVWSLGVLLYTMLYGRFPFKAKEDDKLFELINKADVKFPEDIDVSNNIKNLLKKIFNVDPKSRPSPDDIINEIIFND